MNKFLLILLLIFTTSNLFAQTKMKKVDGGHSYSIEVPEYMVRTFDLNEVATLQYMSALKIAYMVIIEDEKEHLKFVGLNINGPKEFWESFYDGFKTNVTMIDEPSVSDEITLNGQKIVNAEFDAQIGDDKDQIHYFISVVETKNYFYKIMCWTVNDNPQKEKVVEDFKKSVLTLKD